MIYCDGNCRECTMFNENKCNNNFKFYNTVSGVKAIIALIFLFLFIAFATIKG